MQQSIPPLGEFFGKTVTFEEVIASGEVFPPELINPLMKRATAPGEVIAPEEETGREGETALEEETAPEEKQNIPEVELPYLDSFIWGSHRRSKVGTKKFLDLIRGKLPVTQRFTVNNRRDFKN